MSPHRQLQPAFTDLRKLNHAIVLAAEGNYARASARLCITQSALSRSIQALEAEFGILLFDRSHTKVTPTPAARMILERAQSLMLQANSLLKDAALIRDAKLGSLTFGITPSPVSIWIPETLAELYRQHPQLNINIERNSSQQLLERLLDEKIEFFIGEGQQAHQHPNTEMSKLTNVPIYCFVRKDHPLTKLARVTPKDIVPYPIATTYRLASARIMEKNLTILGNLCPEKTQGRLVSNDIESLKTVALNSDAIMISSVRVIERSLNEGLLRKLELPKFYNSMALHLNIFKIKGRSLSPLAEMIIRMIRERLEMNREASTQNKKFAILS